MESETEKITQPVGTFTYSGVNTTIVQHVVEQILKSKGIPFSDYCRHKMSGLGMSKLSSFEEVGADAQGKYDTRRFQNAKFAAGLVTTPEDYLMFMKEVVSKEPSGLSKHICQTMASKQSETDMYFHNMGVGFFQRRGNPDYIFHWGADQGFVTLAMANKSSGHAGVIMCSYSGDSPGDVVEQTLLCGIKQHGFRPAGQDPMVPVWWGMTS